jgi:hypothetical protein
MAFLMNLRMDLFRIQLRQAVMLDEYSPGSLFNNIKINII